MNFYTKIIESNKSIPRYFIDFIEKDEASKKQYLKIRTRIRLYDVILSFIAVLAIILALIDVYMYTNI